MARYREGVSVGSLLRDTSLGGYVPPVDSNAWRAMLREPERDLSGGRRLGPVGYSDAEAARILRSSLMDSGTQQQAWMSGLRPLKEGLYSGQRDLGIFEQGGLLRPLSSMSNDRLSYVNRARDLPLYTELSRGERELNAYPSLSRERESYFNLPSNRLSYADLLREQLTFQNPVRDLSPYMSLTSNLATPDQRREQLMYMYSRRLSQYDLLAQERSPYSVLTRESNHMGTTQDISGLPQSSLSAFRKSRSRSPLGNRDLASLSEVLGRCQSPYGREHSRFMPSNVVSQREFLEDSLSLSHVVQSVKKDGGIGDKQKMKGSVVRVDGLPAENKTGCISMLLDRLGEYGTVTDVQLHKESLNDYALFFYSEPDAAYVALRNVQQNPLFSKLLKLSLWVMVADTDRPITLALTRVMYIENVDKGVTLEMLHKLCGEVGEVLDIELKETPESFFQTAVVQFWKASNAQLAAETLHSTKVGKRVIKTTFGKNTPSNCVWIDGLPKDLSDRELTKHFDEYGHVDKYVFDRQREAALILFPARVPARQCVRYLENGKTSLKGKIIRADYANDRAQLAFCKAMEQSGQEIGDFLYA